jgi:hypothetical protein
MREEHAYYERMDVLARLALAYVVSRAGCASVLSPEAARGLAPRPFGSKNALAASLSLFELARSWC